MLEERKEIPNEESRGNWILRIGRNHSPQTAKIQKPLNENENLGIATTVHLKLNLQIRQFNSKASVNVERKCFFLVLTKISTN